MSTIARQQALLVAEAWQDLYNNQAYVNFQAYTQDNLLNAILNYVRVNYPDSFNDWINNSEFVIKVKVLSWLHQNISYRLDLNIRENFIQTATRREAILMLASNVFYKPNRVTGASGELRIDSVQTNQPIVDSNGDSISNINVFWNDPANPDWFEQFMLIMNAALTPRTQFGHPLVRFNSTPTRADLYMLNSRAPSSGVYPFSVSVLGATLQFAFINVDMDASTGVLTEVSPKATNAQKLLYRSDGRGSGSIGTGFFLPIRQGNLNSTTQTFSTPQPMQTVTLGSANCDNNTIFVQQLDTAGNVIRDWIEVDTVFGRGVAFNTLNSSNNNIFETHTLLNDQIEVQFGDGKFGAIPTDRFKFWYRVVNPVPTAVQPSDISGQTFTIPYFSAVDNTIYYLTVRASLYGPITNGLPTDSNATIIQNIGPVFAAQNRMVTAADYNQFPLNDPSILKIKAVNRTYTGHSAYSRITDPTGFYAGVKLLGEDGRLFRSDNTTSQIISGLTSFITLDEIVLQYLTPLIQSADKQELYYNRYDEILTTGDPIWDNTTTSSGVSKGNVKKSNVIIPVGSTASDEFFYLLPGTYIRYNDLSGPLIFVDRVVGDGTGTDGIILERILDNDTVLFSIMPPIRNQFNDTENSAIKAQLHNLQEFGIGWNQITQTWDIIANSNLNKSGPFSLEFQGDATNTEKDASWFVYFHYIPNGNDGPEWEIVDRGMGIFFESSRDINFVYANTVPQVDPYTGKLVFDNVNILGCNEGRDSLHRLGLFQFGPCCPIIYDFISDGVNKCYNIRQRVESENIFVFVDNVIAAQGTEYTVTDTPTGEEICFLIAPILGSTISIRINGAYVYTTQSLMSDDGDGVTTFFPVVGVDDIDVGDSFFSADGVTQSINDYTTPTQSGVAGFFFSPAEYSGGRLLGYALSGVSCGIFKISFYEGNAATTSFSTNCRNNTVNTVVVLIDGIFQTAGLDYTIDNITNAPITNISFITAPAANTVIVIHAITNPNMVRSAMFTAIANGTATLFTFLNFTAVSAPQVIVALDGIIQRVTDDYTISASGITFLSAPTNGRRINVFVIYQAAGFNVLSDNASCYTTYLLNDKIWDVVDIELTPDGYVDIHGVKVSPTDPDFDGLPDNPYEFDDIVIPDGLTDLVLWRSIVQDGFSVWDPVDQTTIPQATYGFQVRSEIAAGVIVDSTRMSGDIHLDQTTGTWLIADADSGTWIVAPDQSDYKSAIGRSGLKFIWSHYPANNTRIDPAISNIIDMFILPVAYDASYRNWISSGFSGSEPAAPTTESLQVEYSYLNQYRMTDDALIFHPIHYKPLFGTITDQDLQATFLVIKSSGSTISDNDLILRIINSIDLFFSAQNWDLGQSFYLSELIAFVHRAVAPNLQSIVMIAKDGSPFGTLFQIRSAPDELFISVARPSDIKLVTSFNNDNLQMGS
jgi:hypothetical protein